LPAEKRTKYSVMAEKLARELDEYRVGYAEEASVGYGISSERSERELTEKLAKSANISMEQAMEIAVAQHPGKIVEKGIVKVNGEVVYQIAIREDPAAADGSFASVIISGVDGHWIKTERIFMKEEVGERKKPD